MENSNIKIYRKRFIPNELTHLKDDRILDIDGSHIITAWDTLNPRSDFAYGYSAYFLEEGIKVSRLFKADGTLLYHYCDIINTSFNKDSLCYVFEDLLIDVVVMPDGFVKVLDLDEAAEAFMSGSVSGEMLSVAMKTANKLLNVIYTGNFSKYTHILDKYVEAEEVHRK